MNKILNLELGSIFKYVDGVNNLQLGWLVNKGSFNTAGLEKGLFAIISKFPVKDYIQWDIGLENYIFEDQKDICSEEEMNQYLFSTCFKELSYDEMDKIRQDNFLKNYASHNNIPLIRGKIPKPEDLYKLI